MAVLGETSLTGCTSIPGFIGSGKKMIFENATAPVSWTKQTGVNEGTLRVVSGSVSSGGNLTFTQTFSPTKSITLGISPNNAVTSSNASAYPSNATVGSANMFSPTQSVQPATLSLAQIPGHRHTYYGPNSSLVTSTGIASQLALGYPTTYTPATTGPAGSGGAHTHPFQNSSHTHPISGPDGHTHPISSSHGHTSSPSTMNFGVLYVDVIICAKD